MNMQAYELKCIIENIELELEFQDMTQIEAYQKRIELEQAKSDFKNLKRKEVVE